MNLQLLQQFYMLNKTKTIALLTLKFWQKVCFFIIDMYVVFMGSSKWFLRKHGFLKELRFVNLM
jgi:hypothetical protein